MSTSRKRPFDFDVSPYPSLPRAKGVMVVGTDTGVGKTLVAGAIARSLRRAGRKVAVFKPVATGCTRQRECLVSGDAVFLAACAGTEQTLSEVTPVRYKRALAPNLAALREHRPVDLEAIFDGYRAAAAAGEVLVVEGIGGLLCPLSDDFWVIHFARMAKLPLVIVARATLGTINHTLLTLWAARRAGLDVAGVIVNGYHVEPESKAAIDKGQEPPHGDAELAMYYNPQQIALLGQTRVLAIVPQEPGNSVEDVTIGPDTQFAIDQAGWDDLLEL